MLFKDKDIRYWSFIDRELYTNEAAIEILQSSDIITVLKNGEISIATGILTDNGEMIYEGDLVSYKYPVGPVSGMYHYIKSEVEYEKENAGSV
jgi:hypothetical protein